MNWRDSCRHSKGRSSLTSSSNSLISMRTAKSTWVSFANTFEVKFELLQAADFDGLNERLRKVAGWGKDDVEYINMVDNNRVFFECLLEQVFLSLFKFGLSDFPSPSGVGWEEQGGSWGQNLGRGSCAQVGFLKLIHQFGFCANIANSLMTNNRRVHKALTWAAPRWRLIIPQQPLFRLDSFFPLYYETKVFACRGLIHSHCWSTIFDLQTRPSLFSSHGSYSRPGLQLNNQSTHQRI